MTPADSPPARFILRDLPGVADIERSFANPNRHWAKENDDLGQRIDMVSVALFGITDADTEFEFTEAYLRHHYPWTFPDYDRVKLRKTTSDAMQSFNHEDELYKAWELHFRVMDLADQARLPLFEALGWDVLDETGSPLWCLDVFGRQIIAATKGLRGKLPDDGAAEALQDTREEARAAVDLAALEQRLAREAAAFRPSDRR